MRALGADVQHAGAAFAFATPDEEWLAACGDRCWFVLTRDRHIRRRVLEREALQAHGVGAFVFSGGDATGGDTADIVCRLLPKMVNIAVSEARPFIYTFGLSSPLTRLALRANR
jgi:hypothetical protein